MSKVRQASESDIQEILEVESRAWRESGATREQVVSRMETFPIGSIVVLSDRNKIVGYAAAQLVDTLSVSSWNIQTDQGLISSTHKPKGRIAYGVNMSGLPEAAGTNIAGLVINHYRNIFMETGNCDALALGSRAPGFASWKAKNSGGFKRYLQASRNGFSIDPELRLYQKNGFKVLWQMPSYFEDKKSCDNGVMIYSN